jgi:hypothetical protein
MVHIFKRWLPLAAAIVVLSGTIYIASHQVLRQSANDPQIQMARDAAAALEKGAVPASVVTRGVSVDLNTSLAPFISVYDESGLSLESTGVLSGKPPVPPKGVFDYTRANREDRITWQPEPDVRLAIVVVHYGGSRPGFVIAGRSLAETERRGSMVFMLAAAGCIAALAASLVLKFLTR